ncbi:hypothetical protein PRIPAC_76777 [Pristionchus pacificus]|uniref:Uncharacterized protein n=1 Tax=Pristionchus pacificus TaxID=54126 RepID=A0A2A6C3T7_PRIPA|nr:hypothetical protein PRIPAC_76777 [Pristionchus pacificus]|eukprot:PDM72790.1 hypothetical protein PRIPAC_39224 [Pristionchus pacificus]
MGNNKSSNKQPVAHHPSITEVQRLIDRQNAVNNEKVIEALEKLPKFNLKTQDFGSFVDEFNNAQAVLNAKLEVKTAKRVFESLIENEERRLYGQIPEELKRNDDCNGYIKALFDVFHTQAEIRIARRVLTRMEQGSEESVRSFRNRIDNAAGFAYPQSKEERITPSMDAFIFGLRRSLRMKILDRVPEDLNKAFELAEVFEYNKQYEERFPRRSNLDDDDICLVNAITITDESKRTCYFAVLRKQPEETLPREPHSAVTTNCGGILTSMVDLAKNVTNQFGIVNELELVLARGA